MSDKGYRASAGGFINQIRVNLKDRYTREGGGFALVKELVQNADDAGATILHLGASQGINDADHPLLRGPAIFVLNDGEFTSDDEVQLRSFGHNSKAGNQSAIGKFGLGLKSIYHLCEAFFFVGSSVEGGIRCDILNPWSDQHQHHIHADWDEFPASCREAICSRLSPPPSDKWFGLWIPLRREDTLGNIKPIIPYWPGDSAVGSRLILGESIQERIGSVLPLLRTLKKIVVWPSEAGPPTLELELCHRAPRHTRLEDLIAGSSPTVFSGSVNRGCRDQIIEGHPYSGREQKLNDRELLDLHCGKLWPSMSCTDLQTGDERETPEKAEQHAAVCFIAESPAKGSSANLSIAWSVFLPLGEPEIQPILGGRWNISLAVHGYFFIDAGRTRIEGLTQDISNSQPTDEVELRRTWNRRLAEKGSLPLLLPTLHDFFQTSGLTDCHRGITEALQRSQFVRQYRQSICRDHQWLFRYQPDDAGWQLLDGCPPWHEIPRATQNELPLKVFPGLREVVLRHVVTFCGFPRLCKDDSASPWPPSELCRLIESVEPTEVFAHKERLEYMISLLEGVPAEQRTACTEAFVGLVRRIIRDVAWVTLTEHKDTAKKLFAMVPPARRLPLVTSDSDIVGLALAELAKHSVGVVIVPAWFDITESIKGELTADEAVLLVQTLYRFQQRDLTYQERLLIGELAAQLINAAGSRRLKVVSRCSDLAMFPGRDCRERSTTSSTLNQLMAIKNQRLLFAEPSPLAYQLQSALANDRIVLLSERQYRFLFPGEDPPRCREQQMLRCLVGSTPPALAAPASRKDVLATLLAYQEGRRSHRDVYQSCIRYLLHADAHQVERTNALFVASVASGDVWSRAVWLALRHSGDQWRVIHPELAAMLGLDYRREFSVEEIGPQSAAALVKSVDPAALTSLKPNDIEYDELLHELTNDEVCRRLPIHHTTLGDYVAVGNDCYWESDVPWDTPLVSDLTILSRSNNPQSWSRQRRLAPVLDAEAILGLAVGQAQPGPCWPVILDALDLLAQVPPATAEQLKNLEWLPRAAGDYVRPSMVIYAPGIEDVIAACLTGAVIEEASLLPAALAHCGFEKVRNDLFPSAAESLDLLGQALATKPENRIGKVPTELLDDWLRAFDGASPSLLPCFALLKKAAETYPADWQFMVEPVRIAVPASRLPRLLQFLAKRHQNETRAAQQQRLLKMFNLYLRMLVSPDAYRQQIESLLLPTRRGNWRSPSELSLDRHGIDPDYLVQEDTEAVLLDAMPEDELQRILEQETASQSTLPTEARELVALLQNRKDVENMPRWRRLSESAANRLREYFAPWRGIVSDQEIGGFLALLGQAPGVEDLARQYLGPSWSLDEIRRRCHSTLPDKTANVWTIVGLAPGDVVELGNLVGGNFNAPLDQQPDSLLVGLGRLRGVQTFCSVTVFGHPIHWIGLRTASVESLPADRLRELLRVSASRIIEGAYSCIFYRDHSIWDDLGHSDQRDLEVIQANVVEDGFLVLEQLGMRRAPGLLGVLDEWDLARHQQRSTKPAKDKFRDLLENSSEAQSQVLSAVRNKIGRHYQYTADCVPFEIFQNADDASVQWAQFFSAEHKEHDAVDFDLLWDDHRIVFAHRGRQINQYTSSATESEQLGFHGDLRNMLILALSNKSTPDDQSDSQLTGKFGLGFKSVYLITDRPRLYSGRLCFEIRGGMFPRRLAGDEHVAMEQLRERVGLKHPPFTVLELPLNDGVTSTDVIQRFLNTAHVLLAFARHIRRLTVTGPDGRSESVEWQADPIGVSGCWRGILHPLAQARSAGQSQLAALVFSGQHGSVLFVLDGRGVAALPPEVATIWVAAPTRKHLPCGFAINGPSFALDPGRQQLASDPHQNLEPSRRLGSQIGTQFIAFFGAGRNEQWVTFRQKLGLAQDVTAYDFWRSLWQRCAIDVASHAPPEDPVGHLVLYSATRLIPKGGIAP
ncbi:MAG: hypothetical protein WCJ35_18960, partial [Planctomycetota bacterium]